MIDLASLVGIQLRKINRSAAGGLQLAPASLASKLWSGRPAVVVVLRRPGCLFCREEVHKIFARKADFDSIGVHLACIVKEAIPEQIEQFQPAFWASDELYVDEEMMFYKALGGGQVAKKGLLSLASKEVRDNNGRSKAYMTEHGLDWNLSGEGMILGGLLVLRPDEGGIVLQKNESTFGDIAAIEEVVAAAQAAAYAGEEEPAVSVAEKIEIEQVVEAPPAQPQRAKEPDGDSR